MIGLVLGLKRAYTHLYTYEYIYRVFGDEKKSLEFACAQSLYHYYLLS